MKILKNFMVYDVPPAFDDSLNSKFKELNYNIEESETILLLEEIKEFDMVNWLKIKPNVAFIYKKMLSKIVEVFWGEEKFLEDINLELKSIYKELKKEKEKFIKEENSLTKKKWVKIKNKISLVEEVNLIISLQNDKKKYLFESDSFLVLLDKIKVEVEDFSQKSELIKEILNEVKKETYDNLMSMKKIINLNNINFERLSMFYNHNDSWLSQLRLMNKSNFIGGKFEVELKDDVIEQLILMLSLFDKGIIGFYLLKLISIEYNIFNVAKKINVSVEEEYKRRLNCLKSQSNNNESHLLKTEINKLIEKKEENIENIRQELKSEKENYDWYFKLKIEIVSVLNALYELSEDDIINVEVSKKTGTLSAKYGKITLIGFKEKEFNFKGEEIGFFLGTAIINQNEKSLNISEIKSIEDLNEISYKINPSFDSFENFYSLIKSDFVQDHIFNVTGKSVNLVYV